jgi:hypothetical protein
VPRRRQRLIVVVGAGKTRPEGVRESDFVSKFREFAGEDRAEPGSWLAPRRTNDSGSASMARA